MKLIGYIGIVLLVAVLVSCERLPRPAATPSQRGTTYQTLENIDSLMWRQPDSAFAMLQEFASSAASDSLDEFNGHYCQVLVAELLFKNYYAQSNRTEVLKAVGYFDSIVNLHGADARGASPQRDAAVQGRDAFLAARAHYINGAGYYERDSLIEACGEYLNALRTMESHFTESELVGKKARFMALTYNRLLELFSPQFMQEHAIYCGKQSLAYDKIAQALPKSMATTLLKVGTLYEELKEYDSAAFYHEKALEVLSDRNSLAYRDVVSGTALLKYNLCHDTVASLDSLKSMAVQAADEAERIPRYLAIGSIYHDMRRPDSAKVYLERVFAFEKDAHRMKLAAKTLHDIALNEGDTLKTGQYAQFLVEDAASAPEKQMRVSQLNDLFQNYLIEKKEAASLREQRKAVWTALAVVVLLAVVLVAVSIVTRRRNKKRMAVQEAETQQRLSEVSRRLTEATQRHDEAERELQTKVEQAAQHAKEMLQQRAKAIYQSNDKDRLQRIMDEFEVTYPQTAAKLGKAYPDLNETERNLAILTFLRFRAKEEAELLGLSENTVRKYRSALNKKLDLDQFSAFVG